MTQSDHSAAPDQADAGAYRSGAAARLAGLSVETLRVWERRYGVSEPLRSAHGQRLYSAAQVQRLGLIKQLVDQGHAIGALARLSLEGLLELAGAQAPLAGMPAGPIKVALVGDALAQRVGAGGRDTLALDVACSCADLDGAARTLRGSGAQVLLIDVAELLAATLPLIGAAREAAGAVAVVVLYRFGTAATIAQLRADGCVVARAPADLGEIVLLCHAALRGRAPGLAAPAPAPAVAPPRLNEQALAALAAAVSGVECECPRHLAEILLMVGSFERYTGQCGARNPADARLHQELHQAVGQARALLEAAMERLARAEGLPLPPGLR